MRPIRASAAVVCLVAASACAGARDDAAAEQASSAQAEAAPDVLATIERDPASGVTIALTGASRYALFGARVGELEGGRRYALSLAPSAEPAPEGADEARALVDFRKVRRLIGTLADDVADPDAMQLTSLHARSHALFGDTVGRYKEIRAALPAHDYSRTLFSVEAVAERAPGTRLAWLAYEPVPHFACTQRGAPEVHLDLVDVKPDESMLDGFVKMALGHEARYEAHAECNRDASGYACTLDDIGSPWGTARFDPASGTDGRFDLAITRADAARTVVTFACTTVTREALAPFSED
ncbi:MAG: hypothetical protein KF819_29215 [Labilithrix sp.]|nr:hypothetical protein [Labilithrix sp.]